MSHFRAPPFLSLPAVQTVFALARLGGGEARLVGGCVRDYIMGRTLDKIDIDMAVNLPIAEVMALAEKQGIRVLETGLAHGSITLMLDDRAIEVTQTRADIAPDGRHTDIGFTADWQEDAHRRDFTINALYIDQAGALYDDVGAMADLQEGRLRFIGDARARIEEDYLRILRGLRFCAQMPDVHLEKEALIAMAETKEGLKGLSGERIHAELQKSFEAKGWQEAALMMRKAEIDKVLFGVSFGSFDGKFISLVERHKWLVILACLLPFEALHAQVDRLRLSNAEKQIVAQIGKDFSDEDWARLTSDRWYETAYLAPLYLAERAVVFMAQKKPPHLLEAEELRQIALFEPPPCPVTGHDLIKAGVPAGKSMGGYIDRAKRYFAASHFTANKDEILRYLLDN